MERSNPFGKTSRFSVRAEEKNGQTVLTDVSFTAPYKLMRPFQKANGGLQIIPLCASAGIMQGDTQEFHYYVGNGACLEVLSQSFDKIHKMDQGSAHRSIQANVSKNASLYYAPQPVIPFANSVFESETEIFLHDNTSRLFFQDILTAGRVAHDEQFAYRCFASRVRIYRNGTLIYRDNTRYEPEHMPVNGVGFFEGYTHLANLFLSGPSQPLMEPIQALLDSNSECEGAVTSLAQGDLAVRIFGYRSQTLQALAEEIKVLYDRSDFLPDEILRREGKCQP